METKINVIAKDGQALVGKSFHTLIGVCIVTFATNSFQAFREYLTRLKNIVVFFNDSEVVAYSEIMDVDSEAIAICEISNSSFLKGIQASHGKKFTLETMEEFLTTFRDYIDKNGKAVLDFCTNASVNKIIKMIRTKDNSGNLMFNLTRQKGEGDFECPKTISFTIPVIEHLDDTYKFDFDMFLGFKEIPDGVIIELSFRNLNFITQVDECRKKIVIRELDSVSVPKFWGKLLKTKKTDEWKYLEHGI